MGGRQSRSKHQSSFPDFPLTVRDIDDYEIPLKKNITYSTDLMNGAIRYVYIPGKGIRVNI